MFCSSPWNSSYLLGFDDRHKNHTYYFTFYSEFGERDTESYIEVGILILTLVASIACNFALVIPLINSEPKTVTNCFLMNLGLADLLFAIGIPAVVTIRIIPKWPTYAGNFVCKLLPYSQLVCGFTILWSLTLISVERYRCLNLDPNFKISTPSGANLSIVIMWFSAMALFAPFLFWFRTEDTLEICTLVFPKADINIALVFTVLITFFTCVLPMSILVFNYQRIFIKMVESRQRWTPPGILTASLTRQEKARVDKQIKVMRAALANVTVVLVMWMPISTTLCLIYVDGRRPLHDTSFFLRSHHFIAALTVALINTAVNPFLTARINVRTFIRRSSCDVNASNFFKFGSSS